MIPLKQEKKLKGKISWLLYIINPAGMSKRSADNYSFLYNDTTGTSNLYDYEDNGTVVTWWDSIKNLLKEAA